jgi:hypothetical protein
VKEEIETLNLIIKALEQMQTANSKIIENSRQSKHFDAHFEINFTTRLKINICDLERFNFQSNEA